MRSIMTRLWQEDDGALLAAELVVIASILVIGVIVGLSALRDSVVTELADVAQAIANIDQSFSFSGTQGHHAFTGGGMFADMIDFCDTANAMGSHVQHSKCVQICEAALHPFGCFADGSGG